MKITKYLMLVVATSTLLFSCKDDSNKDKTTTSVVEENDSNFVWKTEQFADIKIGRYRINSWDKLSLQQKKLAYYLTQAGYAGRDIIWDQNYRYNLRIRKALENIVQNYSGDKEVEDWKNFMIYTKRVWFANGIHHHYSMDKFIPNFSKDYFATLIKDTKTELAPEIVEVIFNPEIDNKKVSLDANNDLLLASASNFYGPDVTEKEASDFYTSKVEKSNNEPLSFGLNSQLVRGANGLEEKVWKSGGMYSQAIDEIIKWLEKAVKVAENEAQGNALKLLIDYYETGDLTTWDKYNVAWCAATAGDIDYINSFIEVYNDPLGYKGSFETVVQINDFDASEKMAVVAENAQWFEDNSTILPEHKKEKVVGITYKVVEVAGESGDSSPSTPIGVNLPNADWIRTKHGSKSVSLGNIIDAYSKAGGGELLKEFSYNEEEIARNEKFNDVADKMHTALHEVIGHASGKINKGVSTEALKNYSSTLEEARADLVGLYYLMDNKLVEMKLLPSLEAGKAAYDDYIRNGMMTQLIRLEPGAIIEEAHMRNRQLVAAWAFEKGQKDNVIEKMVKDGKTYFVVKDYEKLRSIFGELLMIIQKIKSEGDYKAGKVLVENYGVQVDQALHKEVLARVAKLNIAPYGGFINPKLVPITNAKGEITDIKVEYPKDFTEQMLDYAKRYSFLPDEN
ncbi:MAG: dihydrofolate reductase [Flavobacteriales bacterium CG_4_10_14_0_2_um_filter_32_8]|nr:MAG: dihydrofolate reductase [Flavobacteriales bacterium CG_4_10_14_0_2_um_filter_32_8]PJB14783.1 MAG: dihydrofolate reductase [Flavobacteriales bacterium CG_4_9_14_3_um_filter_32_8]